MLPRRRLRFGFGAARSQVCQEGWGCAPHRLHTGLLGELCAPCPCSPPPPAPHPHPRQQVSLLCRARSLLRVGAAGPGAASAPGLDSSGMSQAVWVVAPCSLGTSPPGTLQPLPVPPQSPSHLSGHPTSWWHPPETPCGKQLVTQAVTLEPCSQLDVASSHCCCPHCPISLPSTLQTPLVLSGTLAGSHRCFASPPSLSRRASTAHASAVSPTRGCFIPPDSATGGGPGPAVTVSTSAAGLEGLQRSSVRGWCAAASGLQPPDTTV